MDIHGKEAQGLPFYLARLVDRFTRRTPYKRLSTGIFSAYAEKRLFGKITT